MAFTADPAWINPTRGRLGMASPADEAEIGRAKPRRRDEQLSRPDRLAGLNNRQALVDFGLPADIWNRSGKSQNQLLVGRIVEGPALGVAPFYSI
jgi:hypothetical protein